MTFSGTRERREIQAYLRKKGQFDWNTNPNINKGVMITSRRPNAFLGRTPSDFTTCSNCLGYYVKNNIRHHVPKCTGRLLNGERAVIVLGRAVEGRLHVNASDRLRLVVFPVLREDAVVRLIRYDWIIIIYGNKLCAKYTPSFQHAMIRARLRLAGRILYCIREINPDITDYASIFNPKFYDSLVEAIKVVARYDPDHNEFNAPATASFAVTQIKQIGLILTTEYIKKEDFEKKTRTDNFLTVLQCDIGISILKLVAETQAKNLRNKKQNIPTTEDVKALAQFLDRERKLYYTKLQLGFDYNTWVKLAELTMASVIVFNRRRTGETQNILKDEFENRECIDEKSNLQGFSALSDEAKAVAKKFSRLTIRGKKTRLVHALLKPGIVECLDLLVQFRTEAEIPDTNEYLFALPSINDLRPKVIDACYLLRKFSSMCGAKNPSSLRGTNMRKHIASLCIGLELNDALVAEVAKFMGHHEKIHRDFYRHNTIENEVVKMSNLLNIAQGGDDSDDDDCNESDDDYGEFTETDGPLVSTDNINCTELMEPLEKSTDVTGTDAAHESTLSILNEGMLEQHIACPVEDVPSGTDVIVTDDRHSISTSNQASKIRKRKGPLMGYDDESEDGIVPKSKLTKKVFDHSSFFN